MSDDQSPRDADVHEINSKLNRGLETCRSVVTNYRTLLSGSHADNPTNDNDPAEIANLSGIDEQ